MQRFGRILVLVNAEVPLPSKLDAAVELARRNGASLTLFDVVQRPRRRWSDDEAMVQAAVATRRDQLQAVADDLDVDGVAVTVRVGDTVFGETIAEVDQHRHDLVVTAPDEPQRRLLPRAPTVLHLLRKCPAPVWVHVDGASVGGPVVVAVGPFLDDTREINERLLVLAGSLAARRDVGLHVVHAWRLEGESLLRSHRSGTTDDEVDDLAVGAERAAGAALDELVAAAVPDGVTTTTHLRKGRPDDVVPLVVASLDPQVLVMGSVTRTGVRGLIVGGTAEVVLGTVPCPVFVIKPSAFESPVLDPAARRSG